MKNKITILNECVQFINKFEILEYHVFINVYTLINIYVHTIYNINVHIHIS